MNSPNKRAEIAYILLFSEDCRSELEEDYLCYRGVGFRRNKKGNIILEGNKDVLLEFLYDRSPEVIQKLLCFHKHKNFCTFG